MSKRKKLRVGDSIKYKNLDLTIEEFFVADFTRWVRCTVLRRKNRIGYNGKKYNIYLTDNMYLTELECFKSIKNNVS